MTTNNNNTAVINPKPCAWCSTRIYWSTADNAYFEVFTKPKQKHYCPNRSNNNNNNVSKSSSSTSSTYNVSKPTYYKKSWSNTPKKVSNSIELISGSIDSVKKHYEILSDVVSEYNGKVHGSQSHILPNKELSIVVYFELPEGKRDDFKKNFNNQIVYNKSYR